MANPNIQRQPFDTKGPFVVRRPFTFLKKEYVAGDEFPHRRLAVDHRRLRLLFDAKYLDMKRDEVNDKAAEAAAKKADAAAKKAEEEAAKKAAEDAKNAPPVAGEGEFLYDPALHAVEKSGEEDWIADEEALLVRITAQAATRLKKVKNKAVIVGTDEILEWPEAEADADGEADDAGDDESNEPDDDEDDKDED